MPNESTLVLGGLIRSQNTKAQTGIPYLSNIPLLGALFRTDTTKKTRQELVILLRPVVSMGPDETIQTRERNQEFMNIEPDLEGTLVPTAFGAPSAHSLQCVSRPLCS